MITGEMKNKVDSIWDTIWTGGITSPVTVLEQITYLMFMKLLDDNQLKAEANANLLGVPLKNKVFQDGMCVISENPRVETEYKNLRWNIFHNFEPSEMLTNIQTYVFPFIKTIGEGKDTAFSRYIAELDERSYREKLWSHTPLTDFWRVGRGYAKKLEENGMFTMGDVARRSLTDEDFLFKLFGKNAELLIDHAWGYEPCTVEAVKAYKPGSNSLGSGQVLHEPYTADKARIVLREMADALSMDLFSKNLVTDQLVVTIGYDIENIKDAKRRAQYKGEIVRDGYGRLKPKHSHGTVNLPRYTSSTKQIMDAAAELYDRVVDKTLLIRRLNITACRVIPEANAPKEAAPEQMDMFTDYAELDAERERENAALEREKRKQAALLKIKNKYGKNAVLRGMNFEKGATMRDRNGQIGGHKA